VVSVMRDDGRRRALESAARRLVVERYDWSAVAGELERALIGFSQTPTHGQAGAVRVLPRREGAHAKAR